MAAIYYTVHLQDVPLKSFMVAMDELIYFFSEGEFGMVVHCMDPETFCLRLVKRPTVQDGIVAEEAVGNEEKTSAIRTWRDPQLSIAMASTGGRIYAIRQRRKGVLWWAPGGDCVWRQLEVNGRELDQRVGGCFFRLSDRHLIYAGGKIVGPCGSFNEQDAWVLDVVACRWYHVSARNGPYLWEGASLCALPGAEPRLYVFGSEQHRHHWNGASFLQLPDLGGEQRDDGATDKLQGRWQRVVLRSSCQLQWKSPCFAMDGCIYAFDVAPSARRRDQQRVVAAKEEFALWRLSADTHQWECVSVIATAPPPVYFDAVAVVSRKVLVLGRTCSRGSSGGHVDLHVVDLAPSLQTLCACVVAQHRLDPSPLPVALRDRVRRMCCEHQTRVL